MDPRKVEGSDEFEPYLGEPEPEPQRFVEVPPALPQLDRRYPGALNRPYRGVGVEGPRYEDRPTGAVWAAWMLFGMAIAAMIPAALTLLAVGDWVLVAIAAPIFGLLIIGILRTIHAEHVAKKKKIARMKRWLRDTED